MVIKVNPFLKNRMISNLEYSEAIHAIIKTNIVKATRNYECMFNFISPKSCMRIAKNDSRSNRVSNTWYPHELRSDTLDTISHIRHDFIIFCRAQHLNVDDTHTSNTSTI